MDGGEACEIGSVPMPNATWLIAAVADFHDSYGATHPYIAVFLCIAGTLMNVVTVIVLTRPSMISPVNVLLCAVAVCDIVVMSSYLIFVWHFLFTADGRCEPGDYSYGWALFTMVHAHVSVVFHATSIWLTVSLAQIRVLTISRATKAPVITVTIKFTTCLAVGTCAVMAIVNLPNVFTFKIVETDASNILSCLQSDGESNETGAEDTFIVSVVYMMQAMVHDCMKMKLTFWSNGMLFKVVPCFLLTISIMALVKLIADVSHRRRSLAQVMKKKKMPKDHTTPMLVAVLSIFLVAELPQGVMLVLNGIYSSETFRTKVYMPLGDFMDLLSLINSAVNFLIYCAMSRKFRNVFLRLFVRCLPSLLDDEASLFLAGGDDASRRRPLRITDLTRTEHLALTSHRPSAVSVLLNMTSRDDLFAQHQRYPPNSLSVGDCYARLSPRTNRRVSFDQRQLLNHDDKAANGTMNNGWNHRSSNVHIAIDELSHLSTTTANHDDAPGNGKCLRRFSDNSADRNGGRGANFGDPIAKLRILFANAAANGEHHLLDSSPQRRLNLMRVESHAFAY